MLLSEVAVLDVIYCGTSKSNIEGATMSRLSRFYDRNCIMVINVIIVSDCISCICPQFFRI